MLLLALVCIILLGYLLSQFGQIFPNPKESLITSLDVVANKVVSYEEGIEMEDFNSPLRHQDNTVLFKRFIVSIKRSQQSGTNPMMFFDMYFEGTSNDTAIEMKDREKEVRDRVQRTAEKITFDEIESVEGKKKLKLNIRKDLNAILNNGRVRAVYFRTIIIKP